jgi:hypothetical protein
MLEVKTVSSFSELVNLLGQPAVMRIFQGSKGLRPTKPLMELAP